MLKEGEIFYEEQLKILPELYKDLLSKDDNGIVGDKTWNLIMGVVPVTAPAAAPKAPEAPTQVEDLGTVVDEL